MQSVAGISNVMPAKSLTAFFNMAQKATTQFVSDNRKMGQGVSGQSEIRTKA